jgi:predicted dithiol-disulfide oxidoreductase (DUF899 family)
VACGPVGAARGGEGADAAQRDELARRRQELPWVRVDKEYRFETEEGSASLADLFQGRSQLLVYHFMFGPDYTAGCPSCSAIADGFDGFVVHLANHDVTLAAVSRAPFAKLQEFKWRMGWTFPWASSFGSDFNFDFNVSLTEQQQREGSVEYNYRRATVPQVSLKTEGHPIEDYVKELVAGALAEQVSCAFSRQHPAATGESPFASHPGYFFEPPSNAFADLYSATRLTRDRGYRGPDGHAPMWGDLYLGR